MHTRRLGMRISNVSIKKFRSIKEANFRMNDITAIVGENNAGKTGILRALNSVFNFEEEQKYFLDKTHQFDVRSISYITITFCDIPKDSSILRNNVYNNEIRIKFKYSYSKNKRNLYFINGSKERNIPNVDEVVNELNKYLMYIYIPSERTNNDISWGENTIFKKLVTAYLERHTKNRDTISSDIKKSSQKIHNSILFKLEKELSSLYMQNKNINFKIDFPNNLDYSSILSFIELSIDESFNSHLLKEWGSGTKSLAIIAMHRAYALIKEKKIILGIEEPETNLHPQAQKRFIHSLSKDMLENEVQTIFTTHSTVLIDELDHEKILLVKRIKDSNRVFVSDVRQVSKDFFEKYNINSDAHYNFFGLRNSDFFFAKHVVICESPIDAYVIESIIHPHIKNEIADVSFITLDGIKNISYPYFLLKELSIPFSFVVDYDFFFDYKNEKMENSRNKNGFPEYKKTLTGNESKLSVIKDFMGSNFKKLEGITGYRKFFNLLKAYNFYPMMYCLEMDLICSAKAREKYYEIFKIMDDKKSGKTLLLEQYKALKKRTNIIRVVNELQEKEYPESFNKIKNEIVSNIRTQQ